MHSLRDKRNMIIQLHPKNPEVRTLKIISDTLREGGVYIFPTDTVYALIADSQSRVGVEKIYKLKDIDKNQPLALLCPDISTASDFIENLPNNAFRLMKRITPGPFTFILKANKNLPRVTLSNHKTKNIGIRIPDNIYLQELLRIHKGTLTSTSVLSNDEYVTDIEDLEKLYGDKVEGIINGGILRVELSTIIDFSSGEMEILREGKGMELLEDN
jgi:tRNA threonylcarbamoyl adenosine modification protein (Sua5/YciO/YrdC/YwlC family)